MECGDNGVNGPTVLRNACKVVGKELECVTIHQQPMEGNHAQEIAQTQLFVHPVSQQLQIFLPHS